MTDAYAVFGNPIAHSKSPLIHAAFARQTGQDMVYTAMIAPLDGFAEAVATFRLRGGRGANVTVPFKEQAYALATRHTPRARAAGAVNTLKFEADGLLGDNTDGAGLVQDLVANLGLALAGRRILLMGAGGAARGVILPLLEKQPRELWIANRTLERAEALKVQALLVANHPGPGSVLVEPHAGSGGRFDFVADATSIEVCRYESLPRGHFDLVINATAASLAGELPPLPNDLFAPDALAYDMMYGRDTPFLAFARERGVRTADGLGMLVEQAAEAFFVWRDVRPETAPVIQMLRRA